MDCGLGCMPALFVAHSADVVAACGLRQLPLYEHTILIELHNWSCTLWLLGIEAALWSELVRTPGRMDAQLWPRLLAVSERSWHKAAWEHALQSNSTGEPLQHNKDAKEDLARFMTLVGHKELRRLEAAGVEYYIPRPGARCVLC